MDRMEHGTEPKPPVVEDPAPRELEARRDALQRVLDDEQRAKQRREWLVSHGIDPDTYTKGD